MLALDPEKEAQILEKIVEFLNNKGYCSDFREPVLSIQPELAEAYLKVIDQPMDLGTILKKIKKKEYTSYHECGHDIALIFQNCLMFNSQIPTIVAISSHALLYAQRLWENIYNVPMHPRDDFVRTKYLDEISIYRSCRDMTVTSQEFMRIASLLQYVAKDELEYLNVKYSSRDIVLSQFLNRITEALVNELAESPTPSTPNSGFRCAFLEVELEEEWESLSKIISENFVLSDALSRIDRLVAEICIHLLERETRGLSMSSIWGRPYKLVWAQPNRSPWWPGMILAGYDVPKYLETINLSRIPAQIMTALTRLRPKSKISDVSQFTPPKMYIVEFFGPTHDFGWVKAESVVEYFALEDGSAPINISTDQLTHDATALSQALDAYKTLSSNRPEPLNDIPGVLESYISATMSLRVQQQLRSTVPTGEGKPRKRKPNVVSGQPRDSLSKRDFALKQTKKYSVHLQTVRPIFATIQAQAEDRPLEPNEPEVDDEQQDGAVGTVQSTPPKKKRRRRMPLLVDENSSKYLSSEFLTTQEQALAAFQGCARLIKHNKFVKYTSCPVLHSREINFNHQVFYLENKSRDIRKQMLKAEIARISKELESVRSPPEAEDEQASKSNLIKENLKVEGHPKPNLSGIRVGLAGRGAKRGPKPKAVPPQPGENFLQLAPQSEALHVPLVDDTSDLSPTFQLLAPPRTSDSSSPPRTPDPASNLSSLAMRMMPFSFQ